MVQPTHKEVLYGHSGTDKWNVRIDPHLDSLRNSPARLFVTPMVRGGKKLFDDKEAAEAPFKFFNGLDIVVDRQHPSPDVIKIEVGHNKPPLWIQDTLYLGELLSLKTSDVLEHPLSYDDIKTLVVESDLFFKKISLYQVRRRLV